VELATTWNDHGQPSITVWRTVFDRLAPGSIEAVGPAIEPTTIRQGNVIPNVTPGVLDALTAAYKEAAPA